MSKPMIKIHNATTGEIVEREMNDEELQDYNDQLAKLAASEAEAEAKATAKSALLNKLGITAEEATLLLS